MGWTSDHVCTRFAHHRKPSKAVGQHLRECGTLQEVDVEDIDYLASTKSGDEYGMTLEAIWQQKLLPTINTKEEYKFRTLNIVI